MGAHNRITEEKYKEIKKDCKLPSDDIFVMEKHKVSQTTVRYVRNTANYQEYCERVFRYHGHPKGARGSVITKTPQQRSKTLKNAKNSTNIIEQVIKVAPWAIIAVCVLGLIILGVTK